MFCSGLLKSVPVKGGRIRYLHCLAAAFCRTSISMGPATEDCSLQRRGPHLNRLRTEGCENSRDRPEVRSEATDAFEECPPKAERNLSEDAARIVRKRTLRKKQLTPHKK